MYLKTTPAPLLPFKKSPILHISRGLEQSLAFSPLGKALQLPCL